MGRLIGPLWLKLVGAAAAVLLLAGGAGIALWSGSAASQAAVAYRTKRQALDASLRTAAQQGYSGADLAPITSQLNELDSAREPWWLPERPGYFQGLAARAGSLQGQLVALERRLVDQAQADASRQADAARAGIAQDQHVGAADLDVQSLQQRLDAVARGQGAAHTLKDYRAVAQQAQSVAQDSAALYTATQQENQAIATAAAQLLAQDGGNLSTIQLAGSQAVSAANNDATVIAYLSKEGPFKGSDTVARIASRLGRYAGLVISSDVDQAALGAAAAQRYSGQIHDALMTGLPAKVVIVSFQSQHLWAYENAKVAMETPVTTGIWGVGDFGTDFGPMKVLWRSHPWTMKSPWPKTSPYWYPDTVVQWTTFFTNTGESIHDAAWEPDSLLGPGSQYNLSTRSHGCIHVPYGDAEWMYNWSFVGMPVIVYPGDGSSVANQLSKITTDDNGTPRGVPH